MNNKKKKKKKKKKKTHFDLYRRLFGGYFWGIYLYFLNFNFKSITTELFRKNLSIKIRYVLRANFGLEIYCCNSITLFISLKPFQKVLQYI